MRYTNKYNSALALIFAVLLFATIASAQDEVAADKGIVTEIFRDQQVNISLKQGETAKLVFEIPIKLDFFSPTHTKYKVEYLVSSSSGGGFWLQPINEERTLVPENSAVRIEAEIPLGSVAIEKGFLRLTVTGLPLSEEYQPEVTFTIQNYDVHLAQKLIKAPGVRPIKNATAIKQATFTVDFTKASKQNIPAGFDDFQQDIKVKLYLTDISVKDKEGNFVTGLKPEDFKVKLAEKKVDHFTLDEYSSKQAGAAKPPRHLHIIVFDRSHMNFDAYKNARLAAIEFIQNSTREGDLIASLLFSHRYHIIDAITMDRQRAIENIRKFQLPHEKAPVTIPFRKDQAITGVHAQMLKAISQRGGADPAINYFKTFCNLVYVYEKVPGKKNLLLFSEGVKWSDSNFGHEKWDYYRFLDALNRCKTSFYPINRNSTPDEIGAQMREAGLVATDYTVGKIRYRESGKTPFLEEIARNTRGTFFHNTISTNDVISSLKQEMNNYYQLGFRLTIAGNKENFNLLEISARNKDYQVFHRKNLYTPKGYGRMNRDEKIRHLEEGFLYNSKENELGVKFAHCLEYSQEGNRLHLNLGIPGGAIQLDKGRAELEIVIHIEDLEAKVIGRFHRKFSTRKQLESINRLLCSFPINRSAFSVWVAIRDNNSGDRSFWNFHPRISNEKQIRIHQPVVFTENVNYNMSKWEIDTQEDDQFKAGYLKPTKAIACPENIVSGSPLQIHFSLSNTDANMLKGARLSLTSQGKPVAGKFQNLTFMPESHVTSFDLITSEAADKGTLTLKLLLSSGGEVEIRFPLFN